MKIVLGLLSLLVGSAAQAGSVDSLRAFVKDAQTVRAQFSQTVLDRNGRSTSQASGVMAFSRPSKFRWTYEKPSRN